MKGSTRTVWRYRLHKWRTSRLWAPFAFGLMLGASILLVQLIAAQWQEPASARLTLRQDDRRELPVAMESVPLSGASSGGLRQAPAPSEAKDPSLSGQGQEPSNELENTVVRVYLTDEKRIEKVPLETYVRGVIAGEMPPGFELEALKAQAIAARTYIVRRLALHDKSGMPVDNADVTDTEEHQVYVSRKELESGTEESKRNGYLDLLDKAVNETAGQIVTYDGKPIEAVFFSTSNGYTENSEDYWQEEIPYLRSVASPWDKELSPNYKETVTMKLSEFYAKLGIERKWNWKNPAIKILKWTDGKRIAKVRIAGKTYTGREVRERLQLASSQFTWKTQGDSIAITTYGYGHGIGMSQWGANGLAKEGRSADYILSYYYTGTKVIQASKLADLF